MLQHDTQAGRNELYPGAGNLFDMTRTRPVRPASAARPRQGERLYEAAEALDAAGLMTDHAAWQPLESEGQPVAARPTGPDGDLSGSFAYQPGELLAA